MRHGTRRVVLYRFASRLTGSIPLPIAYRLARFIGLLLSFIPTQRREAVRENVGIVLGATTGAHCVRRHARRAQQHAMLNYMELMRMDHPDMPRLIGAVHVLDWSPVLTALAEGNGVILVSAHLGNFDTVSQVLPLRGLETFIPMERIDPPEMLALVQAQRQALGMTLEPIGSDTFARMTAVLRRNGVVIIVCDRDIQGTGEEVTFCGRQVRITSSPVLLALRTGAPVVGAFGYRRRDNRLVARLTDRIDLHDLAGTRAGRGGLRHALETGTQRIAEVLEAEIRSDPGQWVVQQRVFGTAAASARSAASSTRTVVLPRLFSWHAGGRQP